MANRNVKVMGYTDNTDVNLSMRFNDIDVYDGTIPQGGTSESPIELFTFEIDQTLNGNINSITTASGGSVTLVGLTANYSKVETPGDGEDNGPVTADDVINDYEYFDSAANTSKGNINVNGESLDKLGADTLGGNWHVLLNDGDSMICDYVVGATPV